MSFYSRRQFIKTSVAFAAGVSLSAFAKVTEQQAQELVAQEREKLANARYHMRFASPYPNATFATIPHMQQVFKQTVESLSQGQIAVEIFDGGQLGVGTELMAAVLRGQIDAGLVSVANFSRALPMLDVLNIPFWVGNNQAYLNLITSDLWRQKVLDPIRQQGRLQVLYHYVTGGRTITSTKQFNQLITRPAQLQNVILRVPASQVLTHFYQLTGAHVIDVPWAKVASMARKGHIQIIDPGIVGLHAGPDNLKQQIGAISAIESVPDAWVNVVNQAWLNQLPTALKLAVLDAAEATFKQQLSGVSQIQANCEAAFKQLGAKIYWPTNDEKAIWHQQFGPHRNTWRGIKRQLLGSVAQFDALVAASQQPSHYQLG